MVLFDTSEFTDGLLALVEIRYSLIIIQTSNRDDLSVLNCIYL